MNTTAFFDSSSPDTLVGVSPTVPLSAILGVPSNGSGLLGAVFAPGSKIWNIATAARAAAGTADADFVATEIAYGAKNSDTTVAEFLGNDAASLSGAGGDLEMGPSALTLSGYIYIPAGVHEISVLSDDGYELAIGGEEFSEFAGTRGAEATARVADFEGGLYQLDLLYFDAGGAMTLGLMIDGLPVDQSAYYQAPEDFLDPPADVPLIPVDDYHPSFFLGEETLETPVSEAATGMRDVINGNGADDVIDGLGGDDELMGGYGDDILRGGLGDDVLDGGRGSDVLDGGEGNDLLIARSDAGEQRIGQLAIDMPTREDPDGEVNDVLQKLYAFENQPLIGDDVLIGGAGHDTFLIAPQISAKLDIIQEHVKADGSINWAGVAGENNELHDHWVDSSGIDIIADYNSLEDHIAVIGHTANVYVDHANVIGDEALESIITIISKQHGGGGAHDMDLIGQTIVHGDLVYKDDIQTDANVTYGIVDGYDNVAEALAPMGEEKVTTVNGVDYKGYDTRSPSDGATKDTGNGTGTENLGAVTGDPAAAFDNPNFNESMLAAGAGDVEEIEETRAPFEQLGVVSGTSEAHSGTNANDEISTEVVEDPTGLPGALGFWSFGNGVDGAFGDQSGSAGTVKAYTLFENQALLRTDGATEGPGGPQSGALSFDGESDFAFLAHDPSMAVTQGTIAMWVRPDDLDDCGMFVTKDHSGAKDGGHFRLGHTDEGGLFLRMAEGDGGANHSWETNGGLLTEGDWTHLAVSFTEDGVTIYADGRAIDDSAWAAKVGDVATPGTYTEAYLMQNEEPWVFGADQYKTELNDTAQEFATDNEDLRNPFEGAIADFGIWGGFTPEDALNAAEVAELHASGPGEALTNPSGPQPMAANADTIDGLGGDDIIDAGAGDDTVDAGSGNDTVQGGYGNDHLMGGIGNDTLDGGRGSDLLEGGDGDDILLSRSDAGEQRIGQLVLDDPSRAFPDPSVDPEYLKLVDWLDQPLVADDVLVGGDGNDHFLFETQINAKKDILLENTKDDGRTINWHGVAGENARLHDHWVDAFGIDVIADYNAEEDTISVIGHTTEVEVTYGTVDTDGDGIDDDAVSIIRAYSQQGNGGAHDEDNIGYIIVHGDRVEEDDINTNAGVHYGIVDTIDEMQEAVAPTGDTKWTDINGTPHLGYDTRDIAGDPLGSNPEAYSSNPWLQAGLVDLDSAVPDNLEPATVLLSHDGGMLGGADQPIEIPHDELQAVPEGTWAFSFTAYNPGNDQEQALFSKDHSGFEDGGHLTAYITRSGMLKVRFQSKDDQQYLFDNDVRIEPGEEYHLAFTFDAEETALFLNGDRVASAAGFADGMSGNEEDLVLGASTRTRSGEDDNLQWHFDGEIENLVLLDRPIDDLEAVFLSEAGGDVSALGALYGTPPADDGTGTPASEAPEDAGDGSQEVVPPVEAQNGGPEQDELPASPTEDEATEPETSETPDDEADQQPQMETPSDEAPASESQPPASDEPVNVPLDTDQPNEESQPQPDEVTDDPGPGDFLQRLFQIFLSIFGLGGDDPEPAPPEVVDERLNEVETLLSEIVPVTGSMEDEDLPAVEEDPEELSVFA